MVDRTTYSHQDAAAALEEEANRLMALVESLKETGLGAPETWTVGELSGYDQHPADAGTETFEREKDYGLLLSAYEQLEQVRRAQDRLRSGAYGICEDCHWPIDPARLAAMPAATLCLRCKQKREAAQDSFHRPVEEEVLSPPFYRTFNTGKNGFDGEDSWQAVASFGTANTPQDVPDAIEFDDAYINADEEQGLVEETDGIIDLDYRRVTDQEEIYPDVQANPRRRRHQAEMVFPAGPYDLAGAGELDEDLWDYIQQNYPGDPEVEMADELTPSQIAEIAREYAEAMRDEREPTEH